MYAIRSYYDRSPTELRRAGGSGQAEAGDLNLRLKLSYRPPFDWPALIRFLQARAIPGVEAVEMDCYRRTLRIGDSAGVIEVRNVEGGQHLLLSVPPELSRGLMHIRNNFV